MTDMHAHMKSFILKHKIKVMVALLLLILAIYGLYQGFFRQEPGVYMLIEPQRRDIEHKVFATGVLSGAHEVDVGAQVSGQIKEIYVTLGQKVKAGDMLCLIDPKTQENRLKSARAQKNLILAQIKAQKATVKKLSLDRKRQLELKKIDAVSDKSLEEVVASYEIAMARLEELEAQLTQSDLEIENATTNIGYTQIRAPIDGSVYAIPVKLGQTVNANQSTPTLIKIANLDTMVLEAEISEADVINVKTGLKSRFSVLGMPGVFFDARLTNIDLAPKSSQEANSSSLGSQNATSQAVYYNALLEVDNKDNLLRLDMTAQVEILIDSVHNVMSLPLSAIRSDDYKGHGTVYILKGEEVFSKDVVLGLRDEQYIEIKSGLDGTESVVLGDDVKSSQKEVMSKMRRVRML